MDRIYINIITLAKREKIASELFTCVAGTSDEAEHLAREFISISRRYPNWKIVNVQQQTLPEEMIEAAYRSMHADIVDGAMLAKDAS